MNKNIVPTITWNPWNPVAIKKTDPNTESEILNEAIKYSKPCNIKKYTPNNQVIIKLFLANNQLLFNINWWHQVIEIPEDNKITVFNKGTWKGLKEKTPNGGQTDPNSKPGLKLAWKKAQKKEIKKKISLTINNSIPTINPVNTTLVWYPWNVLSRITSRHHTITTIIIKNKEKKTKSISTNKNILTKPTIIPNLVKPTNKGQGEALTIW